VPGDDVHHPPLLERLLHASDWGVLAQDLVAHYAVHGAGLFARYRAFRWRGLSDGSHVSPAAVASVPFALPGGATAADTLSTFFLPVPHPDPVRPDDLIGYEAERELLRRNTAHFLAGYPANNALLYGDRGTGKSSSVKALLHEQSRPGESADLWDELRIVEVPKGRLADFPLLAALLRGRPQRFVVFVDDLSFEEGETQYKDMKAMLEGGLEARPANVVVYATSNRRHLIREQFADRATPGSEEVHAWDTVQEKLSFADRFGLSITFASPDQAHYLAIVEGLAKRRGLPIAPAALRARAVEWAAWHNGRSGRTAKQFVDYLEGELGLAVAPARAVAASQAATPSQVNPL
jgi:predicted AAA+ superfamily ATPase